MPMDVKTLCLGVLTRGPHSGYEIKKFCEEGPFAHFFDAGFGSIYPALRKLAQDGLVVGDSRPQASRPDKVVYRLTREGERALTDSLCEPPALDRIRSEFSFVLFFAHLVPPPLIRRITDRRIAWYRSQIERMERCSQAHSDGNSRAPGVAFTLGWGLAIYRVSVQYLEDNRDDLLAAIEGSFADAAD